jgi:hypothetical protein
MNKKNILDDFKTKSIKPSSLKLYLSNLKRLNGDQEIKNFNFLKSIDTVMDKIKEKSKNTQRTYLISIVSLLKQDIKNKKLYDVYYKKLMEYNKELKDNTTKSDKQNANWIEQEQVLEIYNKLKDNVDEYINNKKISKKEYDYLIDFVVLSLYTLQPPRRCMDFLKMKIVNIYEDTVDKDYNYISLSENKFYFNNYKTAGTYKTQTTDINNNLMNVIKQYIKHHPLNKELKKKKGIINFLVKYNGDPYITANSITRILNKVFEKKISVSMLRAIYLTDKYKNLNKEKEADAKAMGTSTLTADTNYIKTD